MKRYCVAGIIGDGSEFNPYRSVLQEIPGLKFEFGGIAVDMDPQSPNYGKPLNQFVFAIVSSSKIGELMSHPDVEVFPDFPLDGRMTAMQAQARSRLYDVLSVHGINVSNADGFRDVVRQVGRLFNPNFDENNFDLNE